MNIKGKLLLVVFILLGSLNASYSQNVQFAQTSLSNLHKARKQLGKPVMLYLYEDDCPECLKMERLTFTDPGLSAIVNSNILSGKINLNSAEGLEVKKKNKISLAPALIFYDKKGKSLLQLETGMNSGEILKMLDVLYGLQVDVSKSETASARFEVLSDAELNLPAKINVHSNPKKRIKSKREPIIQKPRKTIVVKVPTKTIIDKAVVTKAKSKTFAKRNSKELPSTGNVMLVRDVTKYKTITEKVDEGSKNVVPERVIKTKSNSKKKNRIVQLGAYLKYDDVLKSMYKMKRKTDISLTIIEEITNGKPMYKLVSSEVMTVKDAQSLYQSFKNIGIETFVRKAN